MLVCLGLKPAERPPEQGCACCTHARLRLLASLALMDHGAAELPTMLGSSLPWRALARDLREAAPAEAEAGFNAALRTQDHFLATPTPCGSILKDVKVQNKDGSECKALMCRPQAFLWLAASLSPAFETFLRENLPGGACQVSFYFIWTMCALATN